jgi:hypothetical protein
MKQPQPPAAAAAAAAPPPPPVLGGTRGDLARDTAVMELAGVLQSALSSDTALSSSYFAHLKQSYAREQAALAAEQAQSESGQLRDLREAAELMARTSRELAQVAASLRSVDGLCAAGLVADFEELRRASSARANVATVLEQLDLYAKVPTHIRGLQAALNAEPRGPTLRRVFREWLGLSVWRDRVLGHVEDLAARAARQEERCVARWPDRRRA